MGCPLVVHYWPDLQSVHGLRCYGNITRTQNVSEYMLVLALGLVTVGDRSFASAGPRLWNSLPVDVQSAPSLTTFRQKLKTHLLRQSYPDKLFLTASP